MRRFSFALLAGAAALTFSAAAAVAQTIGGRLGASMSKISEDGTTDGTDWTTQFMGGGFVRFNMGRLGIQPELLYVTKGAALEGEVDGDIGIDYIAVPVLLHFPLTYGSSFAPYLIAGPEFAFDAGCEVSGEGASVDCDDIGLERKSFDIGIAAGGGFAFAMGPGALMLEGRWTHGLSNIADVEDGGLPKLKVLPMTWDGDGWPVVDPSPLR